MEKELMPCEIPHQSQGKKHKAGLLAILSHVTSVQATHFTVSEVQQEPWEKLFANWLTS